MTTHVDVAQSQPQESLTLEEALVRLEQGLGQNPNDLRYAQPLQQLIAASNRSPEAVRLLYQWFSMPGVQPAVKGGLVPLIVDQLRFDAQHYDPRMIGLDPSRAEFETIHKGIQYHLNAAIGEINLLSRFQSGGYDLATAPKFIIAIPKSGSSLLGVCLGAMIRLSKGEALGGNPFAYRGYPQWWKGFDWDLRPEIGADPLFEQFPGGIYKGHVNPIEKNMKVLGLYAASRYVINVRDPRDQLVANFCSKLSQRVSRGTITEPLAPEEVHERLSAFMDNGLLYEALHYSAGWLHLRDPERSIVATYEGLIHHPIDTLGRLNDLYQLGLNEDQLAAVYSYATPVTDRVNGPDRQGHDRRVYPLGWTGRVGIHREYFSPENAREFGEVFAAYCRACPYGRHLAELYPDLLDGPRGDDPVDDGATDGTEAGGHLGGSDHGTVGWDMQRKQGPARIARRVAAAPPALTPDGEQTSS